MAKIAYLSHPVSAEKVAEFQEQGFRIIDLRFKPEKTGKDDYVDGAEAPKKRGRPKKDEE